MMREYPLGVNFYRAKFVTQKSDGADALETVGRRLVISRQATGLQQNEFAAAAGLAPPTYNQYETGVNRPSIENAIALCEAHGLTLDWIYRGDPSGLRYETAEAIKARRGDRKR